MHGDICPLIRCVYGTSQCAFMTWAEPFGECGRPFRISAASHGTKLILAKYKRVQLLFSIL